MFITFIKRDVHSPPHVIIRDDESAHHSIEYLLSIPYKLR